AQHAPEGASELTQARVVRHQVVSGGRVQHARGFQERSGNHCARRVLRAREVLSESGDQRVPGFRRQDARQVFVYRAESPVTAAGAFEMEIEGFQPAPFAVWSQTAVERPKVEHRYLDRRGPKISPLRPQDQASQPTRAVTGTGLND